MIQVRQLKEKPPTDAMKLPRNESKLQEHRDVLEKITNDLLIVFDEWERARPALLKTEFETLRSCQKLYFSQTAGLMDKFIITSPGIPGGGLTVSDLAAASGKPPADVRYSLRRPSLNRDSTMGGGGGMVSPGAPLDPFSPTGSAPTSSGRAGDRVSLSNNSTPKLSAPPSNVNGIDFSIVKTVLWLSFLSEFLYPFFIKI
jgi:hypothetical protein